MPMYQYQCLRCNRSIDVHFTADEVVPSVQCYCGNTAVRVWHPIHITGTRDSFGIKNEFYDKRTDKNITNWKEWERAGFRDPMNTHKDSDIRAGIKEKRDKIKSKKRITVKV